MATLFKPGLVSITFRQLAPDQLIRLVVDAGFQGIEWGGDKHVPHGDLPTARQIRQQTRDAGLETCAYGSYYRFDDCLADGAGGPDPIAALDTAQALGAPTMRIWAGRVGSAQATDRWRNTLVERTRQLADAAADRGLRLDFEFHDHSLTDTSESTLQLLRAIDHPAVGTFWQTAFCVPHADRLDGLKRLVNHVSNIHCNYFGNNPWPGTLPLEDGADDWRDYLAALESTGRPRWLTIEHVKDHAPAQFLKDAAALKQWLSNR